MSSDAAQLILVFLAGMFFGFALFDYEQTRIYNRFSRGRTAGEILDEAEKLLDEAIRAKLAKGDDDGRTSSTK